MLMTGTRSPQEVCSFLRVMGCTTEDRSGCSRVARAVPFAMASFSAQPSTCTLRPTSTLKIGMPVSWHSRLSIRSATPMFSIMVARMVFAVASVSDPSSRAKPALMSSGRILQARM